MDFNEPSLIAAAVGLGSKCEIVSFLMLEMCSNVKAPIRSLRHVMTTLVHLLLSGPLGQNVLVLAEAGLAPREENVSTPRIMSRIMTVWSSWRCLRAAMKISVQSTASGLPGLPAPR